MANEEHLAILEQGFDALNQWRRENPDTDIRTAFTEVDYNLICLRGKERVEAWNQWRREKPFVTPNLSEADLRLAYLIEASFDGANLSRANLSGANLSFAYINQASITGGVLRKAFLHGAQLIGANLSSADFTEADISGANLRMANLSRVDFTDANLSGSKLSGANLSGAFLCNAKLYEADLSGANLSGTHLNGAHLDRSILVGTNFTQADLSNCSIHGISAWDLNLEGAIQSNLVISGKNEPIITVDNIEVAQFVYLLLHNEKIRQVIDTITSKSVLILGRFTPERKTVLDAIRAELRRRNYVPIMFDFERPTERDFTETIMTLAGLCRFIIADITNPSSSPLELQAAVPNYMVPLVPIIQAGERPFAMFRDLAGKYDWVLAPLEYRDETDLVEVLDQAVIAPALAKYHQLALKKAQALTSRTTDDYR